MHSFQRAQSDAYARYVLKQAQLRAVVALRDAYDAAPAALRAENAERRQLVAMALDGAKAELDASLAAYEIARLRCEIADLEAEGAPTATAAWYLQDCKDHLAELLAANTSPAARRVAA